MYNVTSLQLVHTMAFYRIQFFRVGLYMFNLQLQKNYICSFFIELSLVR